MVLKEFNPWAASDIKDYNKLVDEFGISKLSDDLIKKLDDNKYARRGLIGVLFICNQALF